MKTFDSWAWIEYFRGSRAGAEVKALLEGKDVLFTPAVCLPEIRAKYLREGYDPADRIAFIKGRTSIIDVDAAVAERAAQARNSGLVTGDKHFRRIPNVVMLSG